MTEICTPSPNPLRPASQIMKLDVMGASFPTRLSFLRRLIRALAAEKSRVTRPVWNIDGEGYGHAVYSVALGGHTYSLVAFAQELPPEMRTDRVIATAWDAAFVLYDGVPDTAEIARLGANAPLQEAGRMGPKDLVLSRANKSVRLFAEVTQALKEGRQPDTEAIAKIGYLMRTTAVYGNGKFGLADRSAFSDRAVMNGPFAAEMLAVWLIRGFTHDLIEHVGGGELDRHLKRHLGIGNSTGLGMAPFLVSHPLLLNNWVLARESALADCVAEAALDAAGRARVAELAHRVERHLAQWNVPDEAYQDRIAKLRCEWVHFQAFLQAGWRNEMPFAGLMGYQSQDQTIDAELHELIAALVLEANPEIVDPFSDCMDCDLNLVTRGLQDCQALFDQMTDQLAWALEIDFSDPKEVHQFWYVSEEKQEPRLGVRAQEDGAELESPLDIARRIQAFYRDLGGFDGALGDFLMSAPQHLFIARRVQAALAFPYTEIQDNLIGDKCLPIDMLRFKLAMFGASKFDPKSDRWTRITLAQGAPLFDELDRADADDWWLPVFET